MKLKDAPKAERAGREEQKRQPAAANVDCRNSGLLLPPGDYTHSKHGRHLGQTANLT
jgi:hypothetical protein